MKIYPYRTTFDKIETSVAEVTEAGDAVVSTHYVGGRDWVLICRSGEPLLADLTERQLGDAVARGVRRGQQAASVDQMCGTSLTRAEIRTREAGA